MEQALQTASFRTVAASLKDFKQIGQFECVDNRSSCREEQGNEMEGRLRIKKVRTQSGKKCRRKRIQSQRDEDKRGGGV